MVVPAERDYRARSPQRGVLIMDQRPEQQPEWTTQSQQTAGQVPRAAPMEGERPLPLHQGRRLASWGSRVVSYIIDAIFGLLLAAPGGILLGIGEAIHGGVAGALIAIGGVLLAIGVIVQIWQSGWRQGALGQSWGKVIMGLRMLSASTVRSPMITLPQDCARSTP